MRGPVSSPAAGRIRSGRDGRHCGCWHQACRL